MGITYASGDILVPPSIGLVWLGVWDWLQRWEEVKLCSLAFESHSGYTECHHEYIEWSVPGVAKWFNSHKTIKLLKSVIGLHGWISLIRGAKGRCDHIVTFKHWRWGKRTPVKSTMDKPAAHSDARLGQSQFYVPHSSKKQKHNLPDCTQSRGTASSRQQLCKHSWGWMCHCSSQLSWLWCGEGRETSSSFHVSTQHTGSWWEGDKPTSERAWEKQTTFWKEPPVTVTPRLFTTADKLPGASATTGCICPQAISTCSQLCVTAQDSGFIPSFPSRPGTWGAWTRHMEKAWNALMLSVKQTSVRWTSLQTLEKKEIGISFCCN